MFYNFQKNNFESKYKKFYFLSLFMNQILLRMKNYFSTLLLLHRPFPFEFELVFTLYLEHIKTNLTDLQRFFINAQAKLKQI